MRNNKNEYKSFQLKSEEIMHLIRKMKRAKNAFSDNFLYFLIIGDGQLFIINLPGNYFVHSFAAL